MDIRSVFHAILCVLRIELKGEEMWASFTVDYRAAKRGWFSPRNDRVGKYWKAPLSQQHLEI